MNNPQTMEDKQIKSMRWLFRYTATVLSCTAIIVFGITAVSKSSTIVTTSIGQNISTNDLIAYGNATTTGDHYIGGILTVNGSLSASSFTASSTSATNTITGKLLVTNIPTLAHAFATWDTDVANSNVTNASLLINPSSAASDTNLFGIAVNNNVKFMIDAEGDVFVNSLTATGTITQALANISTLSVENNATLGDAITDTVTFDSGNLIFTNSSTTTIPSRINAYSFATSLTATPILSIDGLNGRVGIGTASPNNLFQVAGLISFDNSNSLTFLGYQAGNSNTSGTNNSFVGYQAGYSYTTGYDNVAVGKGAGYSDKVGFGNVFIGKDAGYYYHDIDDIEGNTIIGYKAGYGVPGSGWVGPNNFIGGYSGYSNTTGRENSVVGYRSLYNNTTGHSNSALGNDSLYSNTTGHSNSALGVSALYYNQTGHYNTAVGLEAGYGVNGNSFGQNSLFGYRAGYGLETGSYNTLLGYLAGQNITTGSTNIIIGTGQMAPSATANDQLNIGGLIYGELDNGLMGVGDDSPDAHLEVRTSGYDLFMLSSAPDSNGDLMIVKNSGNVGIGTTSPYAKLSVSGIGVFDDYVYSSYFTATSTTASSTFPMIVGSQLSGGNLWLGSTQHATKGKILFGTSAYDEVNNRMGINTITPGYSLDVNGSASIQNNLLTQLDGGTYYGRNQITENQWSVGGDRGLNWIARDARRDFRGIAMSSDGKYQTATVNSGNIYISSDYGVTWTAKASALAWRKVAMSSDGKYQTAVVSSGQIYVSTDYGATWSVKDSSRAWTDVAMSSDGKKQTALVSPGFIYTSTDYGATWTERESSRSWSSVAMSSDGKYQTAISGNTYISRDYGVTWTTATGGSGGQMVAMSSDGKYQSLAVYETGIRISSDYGANWTLKTPSGSNNWTGIAMSADGKYQSAYEDGYRIYTSTNYGLNWTIGNLSNTWIDIAMSSDGKYQTAVAWGTDPAGSLYTSHASSYMPVGNVGIATSSPYAKLSVAGIAVFDDYVRSSYFVATSTTATSTFAGGVSFGSHLALINTATSSVAMINGLNFDSNTFVVDPNSNRVGIGTAAPTKTLDVNGEALITSSSGVILTLNGTSEDDWVDLKDNGTAGWSGYRIFRGGSTLRGTFGVDASNNLYISTASGANRINMTYSDTGTTVFNENSYALSHRFESDNDANLLFLSGSSDKVGIGTSSPYAKLSVAGIGVFDDYVRSSYFIATSTTASSTFPMIVGSQLSGGNLWLGSTQHTTKGKIFFGNSAYDEVNNRMGIASSSPFATFAVEQQNNDNIVFLVADTGTSTPHIKVDGAGITYIEQLQTGAMSFDTNAGAIVWNNLPVSATAASGTIQSYTAQIDSTNILTVYALSNGAGGVTYPSVGVGTTTPTEQFSVADRMYIGGTGTSTIQSNLRVMGTMRAAVSYTGDLVFANNFRFTEADFGVNPQALYLKSHKNTDLLYIDENGYMGIGTTTPGAALTVQGNALADAWLTYEVAEMDLFPEDENEGFEEGDLLSISDESGGFVKASQYENYPIVGVAKAVNLWGQDTFKPAMLGTFTLKVSTENGNIYIGDYLTKSSIPGVAMRANEGDSVVGFALEEYSGDSVAIIKIFINANRPSGGSSINSINTSTPSSGFSLSSVWDLVIDEFKLLGITFKSGLVKAREFVGDIVKTKNLEMTDEATGQIYCVKIVNGEWEKILGACGSPAPEPTPAPVSEPTPTPTLEPTPDPASTSEPAL